MKAIVFDRELIVRILLDGIQALRYVMDRKITPNSLGKPYNKALAIIIDAYQKHGALPSIDALSKLLKEELPHTSSDALTFLADHIVNREMTLRMRDVVRAAAKFATEQGKTHLALQHLQAGAGKVLDDFQPVSEQTVDYASDEAINQRWEDEQLLESGLVSTGVSSPWPTMMELTGGFQDEQICTILGGTSKGKTQICVLLLKHFLDNGVRSLLVSMEASARQICNRLDALGSQLPLFQISRGRLGIFQTPLYRKYLEDLREKKGQLFVSASNRIRTVADIDEEVKKIQPRILIIDAVYYLRGQGSQNWERLGEVIQEVKSVARTYRIPVIITSQFSKEGMKRKDGGRLTEAGFAFRIAQDSPLLIALKEEDEEFSNGQSTKRIMEILKQSEGPLGSWTINWDWRTMDFQEIPPEEPVEATEKDLEEVLDFKL